MNIEEGRKFLRFFDQEEYEQAVPTSDQEQKKPMPLKELPYPADAKLIDLVAPANFQKSTIEFNTIISNRKSRRKFKDESLSLEELSFLLWCTQGVKKDMKFGVFRTVPSAGARSPFETYLYIRNVEGLKPGLYRYISLHHKLLFMKNVEDSYNTISNLAYNQKFCADASVVFFWVAIPNRTEWRYTILAHKYIAVDLGMVCENLYLACEARKLGTVAIGYYEQNKLDILLELNPEEALSVLLAPVGKISQKLPLGDFLHASEPNITEDTLNRYVGTFRIPDGPQVDVVAENGILKIISDVFNEEFRPHNKTEFVGGEMLRAIRFVSDADGKIIKMIILPGLISDKDQIEMVKVDA